MPFRRVFRVGDRAGREALIEAGWGAGERRTRGEGDPRKGAQDLGADPKIMQGGGTGIPHR